MTTHLIISIVMTVLAAGALASAVWAMARGLTYSAVTATVAALAFIGISNLAHATGEFLGIGFIEDYHIDHLIIVAGYLMFIWLVVKGARVKTA
ncbi:MAG: hypothetical protein HYW37_00870 [Candidatus Colwellbacteria bacterium]|nr:hypothetical protein [Candidatus Colwellbacteria bacterium]